jgi:hypothetical protein
VYPFEYSVIRAARKETQMPFSLYTDDETCPKCRKPVNLAIVEPHPTRCDLSLHNFECADCGFVRTKILSQKPSPPPPELAA